MPPFLSMVELKMELLESERTLGPFVTVFRLFMVVVINWIRSGVRS